MTGRRVGRPRAIQRPDSGLAAREELLGAAAELFTRPVTPRPPPGGGGTRGPAPGHDVPLLRRQGGPPRRAPRIDGDPLARPGPPAPGRLARGAGERLRALCRFDVELLCGGPHNLGALYLLPEVRAERFAAFHRTRAELKAAYAELLAGDAGLRGAGRRRAGAAYGPGVRPDRGCHPHPPLGAGPRSGRLRRRHRSCGVAHRGHSLRPLSAPPHYAAAPANSRAMTASSPMRRTRPPQPAPARAVPASSAPGWPRHRSGRRRSGPRPWWPYAEPAPASSMSIPARLSGASAGA